ncbi:MAG: M48 family metallopeptidase, partial [Ignavibacteria bacterium]|nr:M48 family metallopeptidase [Ignavibacteria bacterium]
LMIWTVLSLVSYFRGSSILLAVSKAQEVTHDVHPRLFNIVEEMKIAANLPAMPKVYIIPDPAPNAFATGMKPEKSAVAVTAGLLSKLNRDELQGVVAHEMAHILNRDVLFVTFAGILLGSIVLISHVFLRGMFYSSLSGRRYSGSSRGGGGQAQLVMMVVAIVLAILVPIMARLLYFAISRKREYLADASAARLTRYPEGLASALEKIASSNLDLASANKVTAPMYIANPLKKKGRKLSNLTSTHPPITERIQILRSMSHGVNFLDYQKAYSVAKGKSSPIIPTTELAKTADIPIRKASSEKEEKRGKKKEMRDLGDLMRKVNKYAFLVCTCGLKLKLPPDLKKNQIACPRCSREIEVPLAELAAVTAAAGAQERR